jgi:molybdopterin-guanine dinucleotide biosynthesis protein B
MFDKTVKTNQTPARDGQTHSALPQKTPPTVSFVGHSGSGKTTFIEKLIRLLTSQGIRVALIKHDVHGFEMDKPGKDTWRHKKAGAVATLISSANQIGLVMDSEYDHQPEELLPLLPAADLIIIEGYKRSHCPKIEVFRPEATGDAEPICLTDPHLIAIISDLPLGVDKPLFTLSDVAGVAAFLRDTLSASGDTLSAPGDTLSALGDARSAEK